MQQGSQKYSQHHRVAVQRERNKLASLSDGMLDRLRQTRPARQWCEKPVQKYGSGDAWFRQWRHFMTPFRRVQKEQASSGLSLG
jgi:hypothetical protein